ncbi:MAG: class I SAM-dependent methyltransferase [Parashewanella sp.]
MRTIANASKSLFLFFSLCGISQAHQEYPLKINNQYRTPAEQSRDQYRHPAETLKFFNIKPTDTLVEVWPSAGWYTQILAPMLKDRGQYIAAHYAKNSPKNSHMISRAKFEQKFKNRIRRYGEIAVTSFEPPMHIKLAPTETADVVLTFRNIHNWMSQNQQQNVFNAIYDALKPGGTFGVVEHKAKAGTSFSQMINTGYVTEDFIKQLALNTGFQFIASSNVNANPKDYKNYPYGVWTLPPTLALGEIGKKKYLAIGESDRMTLKFKKPI